MLKVEVKECQKNDHKGFQIVAVDLSEQFNKENDQKRFYCVKCLIEKIGSKKIILYEEAIKKGEDVDKELKINTEQQKKQQLENIQKMREKIKIVGENLQQPLGAMDKQIEQYITNLQNQLEAIPEPSTIQNNIKLLSDCQKEDGQFSSPQPKLDNKELVALINQINKFFDLIKNNEQLLETKKHMHQVVQQSQISQEPFQSNTTPALSMICETHQREIIMLNLSQVEFEEKIPFLCVDCIQNCCAENKAISSIINLTEANKKWKKYLGEQDEKRFQRQARFNQAIGIIKKLQEKYNQELCKIIQSLNDQITKEPQGYEKLQKLKNISLFQQEKQNLLYIIEILGQTEKQKNQEKNQNQEDFKFYQSQKKLLEELIKENLVVENQLQWLQNYDQQPQKSNDASKDKIENDQEVIDFLKKTTIQDQYLSFFEISFNSLKTFKQEEQDLKQKGKLEKLQQSEVETQSQSLLIFQKWYKQFQDNQAKLEKLMKVDEIEKKLTQIEQEKSQILIEDKENKQKISDLEVEIQEQYKSFISSQKEYQDIDQALIKKNNLEEQMSELKQVYSIITTSWQQGESKLLQSEFAQKIFKFIQEKTKREIKNKYLIYSSAESGLNRKTFWDSVDKKCNLLMIFKSTSQYIFGGFSPCQWIQSSRQYQADESLSSFLFSQTQDQIYPLLSSNFSSAIMNDDSYISFGYQDIKISYDFQNGSSLLGGTYQCNQYKINNYQNHLFGQATPNIKECEILMITFKNK
ncbi:unnamed protein product [Paramecium sonneborni]|uniref:TLDc domain-containing protein n=2 Tax=Paramecium sonneborni TaxID=65129 RepID=A0A8S1QDX0_9CILI|nr:unnamed protein product [Paramecium sonneborni]